MKQFLKTNIKAVIALLIVLAAAVGVFLMSRSSNVGTVSMEAEEKLIKAQVISGDVSSLFYGSGTLTDEDYDSVTLPDSVEVESYAVRNGERVSKGDRIARLDKVSVMKAISELQAAIDELDTAIIEASDDTVSSARYANCNARVKAVYAAAGDNVADVMFEHGSLMLLSLDGCMACDLPSNGNQSIGDHELVVRSDGTTLTATVAKLNNGIMTVICSDNGTKIGEQVTVTDESGIELGTAELYIHVPEYVTAFTGTVGGVFVNEEDMVSTGQTLIYYNDTAYKGEYDRLLALRSEYTDTMQELFEAANDGYIRAPSDGIVTNLDDSADYVPVSASSASGTYTGTISLLTSSGSGEARIVLLTAPNNIPEPSSTPAPTSTPAPGAGYTKAAVVYGVNGKTLLLLVTADPVPSGTNPASLDPSLFTEFSSVENDGTYGNIGVGTYLLLNYSADGKLTGWTVSGGGGGGGGLSGGGGGGGMSFGTTEETEESAYELSEKSIFSVIPYDKMTITVSVDELDILSLREGQTALVTLDAFPGRSFEGIVTNIDPTGTNSGGTTKYTATVTIERSESMLAGMNASACITLSEKTGVPLIPLSAISEEGGKSLVYTGYDEKNDTLTNPVEITTGLSDGENVEILSGLNVGDTIYYRYADSVKVQIA